MLLNGLFATHLNKKCCIIRGAANNHPPQDSARLPNDKITICSSQRKSHACVYVPLVALSTHTQNIPPRSLAERPAAAVWRARSNVAYMQNVGLFTARYSGCFAFCRTRIKSERPRAVNVKDAPLTFWLKEKRAFNESASAYAINMRRCPHSWRVAATQRCEFNDASVVSPKLDKKESISLYRISRAHSLAEWKLMEKKVSRLGYLKFLKNLRWNM